MKTVACRTKGKDDDDGGGGVVVMINVHLERSFFPRIHHAQGRAKDNVDEV